jgi:hypothetical protein
MNYLKNKMRRIIFITFIYNILMINLSCGGFLKITGANGNYEGVKASEKEIVDFIIGIKHLNIGSDTPEEVISKTGSPETKNKQLGLGEVWNYRFVNNDIRSQTYQVNCTIIFNSKGILQAVSVDKLKSFETKAIYTKGDPTGENQLASKSSDSNTVNISADFPANPQTAQLFFNATDKHFYGWNGTEWIQLDNSKINP